MPINDIDRENIKHAANADIIRRMLIQYFIQKGFTESFDRAIHPLAIQDMPYSINGLDNKVEIEPHAVNIDPTTGQGILGWNLFVLGNQRMYLGETFHPNLKELARQIRGGQIMADPNISVRRQTTPRRLITFVTRTLGNSDAGYVDLTSRTRPIMTRPAHYRPMRGPSQDAQFYSRSGYGT